MIDEILLEQAIKNSGKRYGYLAEKLGCAIQTFKAKRTNRSDFTNREIDILCEELNITSLRLKERIFFKKNVEEKETV